MSAEDDAPLRAAPSREESRRALGYVALFSLLTVVPGLSLLVRGSTRASGGARRSAEFASPLMRDVHGGLGGFAPFWVRGERCLDGSTAGGFMRPSAASSDVVVFLQGGGYCDDHESCSARAADGSPSSLGSSRGWREETCPHALCGGGVASPDCDENPDFCMATLVYLRYCSGDHWLGTRAEPVALEPAAAEPAAAEPTAFYFSGRRILDAALDRHLAPRGLLGPGARLLLGGRSMGGVGVAAHVDAVAARYPKVDVRGLVGWALATPGAPPPPAAVAARAPVPWGASGGPADQACDRARCWELYGAAPSAACARAATAENEYARAPWRCAAAPADVLAAVDAPLFVAASPWSAIALGGFPLDNATCGFVRAWGAASALPQLAAAAAPGALGVFGPSCFRHAVPWDSAVDGVTFQRALGSWWRDARVALVDEHGSAARAGSPCATAVPCNPTCDIADAAGALAVRRCVEGGQVVAAAPPAGAAFRGERGEVDSPYAALNRRAHAEAATNARPAAAAAAHAGLVPPPDREGAGAGARRPPPRRDGGGRCATAELRAIRDAYARDGVVIARGFVDEPTLRALEVDLEGIVDDYARALAARGVASARGPDETAGLPFAERYTALYRANRAARGGEGSDLPTFFRREVHARERARGTFGFVQHSGVKALARCLLDAEQLRLYPVYMLRGKPPDAVTGGRTTVDWHQDAEYTYYWYSNETTTREQMDAYAASIVNMWVSVADTPEELGPVQLVRRGSLREPSGGALTRADMRCNGAGCVRDPLGHEVDSQNGELASEFLRVADIDEYVEEHPDLVATAEMRRGDVLLFNQYTYHRGLPNRHANRTRWSLDFRFQDARVSTLRGERGFLLDDGPVRDGAPLVDSLDAWAGAKPSLRLSEARALANNFALGGHHWGELHTHKDELRSAMELEQKPYEAYRRALRAALPAAASSTTTRRRGQSALLPGEELAHD